MFSLERQSLSNADRLHSEYDSETLLCAAEIRRQNACNIEAGPAGYVIPLPMPDNVHHGVTTPSVSRCDLSEVSCTTPTQKPATVPPKGCTGPENKNNNVNAQTTRSHTQGKTTVKSNEETEAQRAVNKIHDCCTVCCIDCGLHCCRLLIMHILVRVILIIVTAILVAFFSYHVNVSKTVDPEELVASMDKRYDTIVPSDVLIQQESVNPLRPKRVAGDASVTKGYTVNFDPSSHYFQNVYMNSNNEVVETKWEAKPLYDDGKSYVPRPHGTLTYIDKQGIVTTNKNEMVGFRIDGINTDFVCPNNWVWDSTATACVLSPFCTTEDAGFIKGIDYEHWQHLSLNTNLLKTAIPAYYTSVDQNNGQSLPRYKASESDSPEIPVYQFKPVHAHTVDVKSGHPSSLSDNSSPSSALKVSIVPPRAVSYDDGNEHPSREVGVGNMLEGPAIPAQQQSAPTANFNRKFYVECTADTNSYILRECVAMNEEYINVKRVVNSANISPCVPFDVCDTHPNGYKHRMRPSALSASPTNNEYFTCMDGKSILKKCEPGTILNQHTLLCEPVKNVCNGKADNTTGILAENTNGFYVCFNNKMQWISCPQGTHFNVQSGQYTCINGKCGTVVSKTFQNSYFNYPVVGVTCDSDNQPKETSCLSELVLYPFYIDTTNSAFVNPKSNAFLDTIYFNPLVFNVTTKQCEPVYPFDYATNNNVARIQYADYLVPATVTIQRRPIIADGKFFNKDGQIWDTSALANDPSGVGEEDPTTGLLHKDSSQFIPFVYTNELIPVPIDQVDEKIIDPPTKFILAMRLYTATSPLLQNGASMFAAEQQIKQLPIFYCLKISRLVEPVSKMPVCRTFILAINKIFVLDVRDSLVRSDYVTSEDNNMYAKGSVISSKFHVDQWQSYGRVGFYECSTLTWYGQFLSIALPHFMLPFALQRYDSSIDFRNNSHLAGIVELSSLVNISNVLPDTQFDISVLQQSLNKVSFPIASTFDAELNVQFIQEVVNRVPQLTFMNSLPKW